ncbi:uncharacterized protein LOC141607680 [Silene latifolia]|uniref:uncharacterized protein LOC141607680 n=1 Tax=Silene latifolia TaxID=37657 RepID=UPI003D77FB3B
MARSRKTSSPLNSPSKNKKNNTISSGNKSHKTSITPNNNEIHEIIQNRHEAECSKVAELRAFDLSKELNVIAEDKSTDDEGWQEVSRKSRSKSPIVTSGTVPTLKIDVDDVKSEVEFWSSSVLCYVMGANPPSHVVGGFVRRLWGKLSIDKVAFKPNGICIVRFKKMEDKEAVLNGEHCFFDNKPFIVKSWSINEPVIRAKVDVVPVWVRFYNLDLKFWGAALAKIAGLVGKPVCSDSVTKEREFLDYARFMVEVQVGQSLPEVVEFFDESGMLISQSVHYEWKPIICSSCNGMGHETGACKKVVPKKKVVPVKKVWVPKPVVQQSQGMQSQAQVAAKEVQVEWLSKKNEGFSQGGPCFVEVLSLSLRRNLLSSLGKGRLTHTSDHGFFGLLETRVKTPSINKVQLGLGDHWQFLNNNEVREGGRIWVVWDNSMFDVIVLIKTAQVLHLSVTCVQNNFTWQCSVVYGFNKNADWKELWQSLLDIHSSIQGPWMVMGDFNNVLNMDERIGAPVTVAEVKDFQECVDTCGLYDLSSTGAYFTWNNKQEGNERVFSRIDRVLANDEWILNGPDGSITFLPEGLYDHSPCLIECWNAQIRQKSSFKYFNMWGKHEQFKEIVKEVWMQDVYGCRMFQVVKKLKWLKFPLKQLNKESYGDIENSAKVSKVFLEDVQRKLHADPTNSLLQLEEKIAARTFKDLDEARSEFLAQKAKTHWFQSGDDNTQFFHSSLKARRAQNKVLQIKDKNGHLCSDNAAIEQAFLDYYSELLGSSASVTKVCSGVVQRGVVLSEEQAREIIKEVTVDEIKHALFSIPKEKAPGPDGYSSQFFKDAFELVGSDVVAAVKEFFTTGSILKQVNATVLSLIPKKNAPESVLDFRPIACCNVIYKCISKVICSRLASVLPCVVSMNQSAFIQGREILDNIFICQDLVRLYNRKNCSPRVMMKIDLKKAYDSIEWSFIEEMLIALNFPHKMVQWIMQCVTSTSFSLFLNGNQFGYFKGCRGIRQGDPMSPLLFTLCMEYLTRILDLVTSSNDFHFHPHLQLSGFQQGAFPFRYLGIPISFKRLSSADSNVLVDKIVKKIRGWGTKKLSYAGRLVLVRHVLSQMHSYWARIFLLPKGVIARVEAICRNYLWSHSENFAKVPLIAWDQCCLPQKYGGLGILNAGLWNLAMLGKYVWWVAQKKDSLWVKWVNHIYIKHQDWWEYQAPCYSSWSWRQLCKVKNRLIPGFVAGLWPDYTARVGYQWLLGQHQKVQWFSYVWNRVALPKVNFVNWLVINQRLLTKDRMGRFGILTDGLCFLCGNAAESTAHLFFECGFSRRCLQLVQMWLPAPWQPNVIEWIIQWRCRSLLKKQVLMAAIAGLVYLIWDSRNVSRLEHRVTRPACLLKKLQNLTALRARGFEQIMGSHREHDWFKNHILVH